MVTFNGIPNQKLYMVLNKPISRQVIVPGEEYDAGFDYINSCVGRPLKIASLSMPLHGDDITGAGVIITVIHKGHAISLFCWHGVDCDIFFGDTENNND